MAEKKEIMCDDTITVLTALEISEALKPEALHTEMMLNERTLSALQQALPLLMEDSEKYRRKAEDLAFRRANVLGVRADRISGESESFDIRDEDEEGGFRQTKITNTTAGMDNTLSTFIHITDACMSAIRHAMNRGTLSVFEMERLPRYLSVLSQKPVRRGLDRDAVSPAPESGEDELRQKMRKPRSQQISEVYTLAAYLVDGLCGKNSPYVVARRLVDKYSAPDTLDELDGFLKLNPVTGKVKDVPIMDKLESEHYGSTGIRVLTPSGKIKLREMISAAIYDRGNAKSSSKDGKKKASFSVQLDKGDMALLCSSLRNAERVPLKGETFTGTSVEGAMRFAENVSVLAGMRLPAGSVPDGMGGIPAETPSEKRNRLLGNMEKIILRGYRGNENGPVNALLTKGLSSFADEISHEKFSRDVDSPTGFTRLTELHIAHASLKKIYQDTKNSIITYGARLSYESSRTMENENRTEFPFINEKGESVNPFARIHPGKLATLCTDMDGSLLRLNSLPIDLAGPGTGTGNELGRRIDELKERCIRISAEARRELEGFLSLDAETATGMVASAIGKADIRADEQGWFMASGPKNSKKIMIPDAERILGKALKEICLSIRNPNDHSDEILFRALDIISDGVAPAKAVKTSGRQEFQRAFYEDRNMVEVSGCFEDFTPATRFALIAGLPVDSTLDSAVPPGKYAYYSDQNGENVETCANAVVTRYGDLIAVRGSSIAPKDLYEEIRKFLLACETARKEAGLEGPDPARIYLERAEKQVKEAYLKQWKESFIGMKDAWASCYRDTDEQRKTLVGTYAKAGMDYGEEIMRRLAIGILQDAGFASEARAFAENPEDRSPAVQYVMRHLAISAIDITLDKIESDMKYAEGKNSLDTDWNRWKDYVKDKTNYDTLMKGTMPVFTDDGMKASFLSRHSHPEELVKMAVLSRSPLKGQTAMKDFVRLTEAETARLETLVSGCENIYDPEVNEKYTRTLHMALSTIAFRPEGRDTALECLNYLEANNPDDRATYDRLRDLISDSGFRFGSEGYGECMDILADGKMEHMSPGARRNPYQPEEVLHAKDVVWASRKKAEAMGIAEDLRADSVVSAEARAKLDASFTAMFSPEISGARYLTGLLDDMETGNRKIAGALEETMGILKTACADDLTRELTGLYVRRGIQAEHSLKETKENPLHLSVGVGLAPDTLNDYGTGTGCPKVKSVPGDFSTDPESPVSKEGVTERVIRLNMRGSDVPAVLNEKNASEEARLLHGSFSGFSELADSGKEWEMSFRNTTQHDSLRIINSVLKNTYGNETDATGKSVPVKEEVFSERILDMVKALQNPDPSISSRARGRLRETFRPVRKTSDRFS